MILIANLPQHKCWVDATYLTQGEVREYWPCYWVSVKSVPGQNYYFETYLPEMGAVYDKLPISAFRHRLEAPDPFMPPEQLQMWDCMAFGVVVVEKALLSGSRCTGMFLDGTKIEGNYLFTLDAYHPHQDLIDTGTAHIEPEHKSNNLIELDNGQYSLLPNNRILWDVASITSKDRKMYPLKLRVDHFSSESKGTRSFGDSESVNYEK